MSEMIELIPHFPYLGIFLLLALGTLGLPFPEDATLMLSGLLVAQGAIKSIPAFLIIYPTLLMTDFSLYWAGKKFGRKAVEHRRFRKLLSADKLQRLEAPFGRWGILLIFFGRQLIGLRSQIMLAAGVTRFPAMKFILADAASALVTIGIIAGSGYAGAEGSGTWREALLGIGQIAFFGLVMIFAGILFLKHLKKRLGRDLWMKKERRFSHDALS